MEECDSENLQTAPGCNLTSCLFLSLAVRIIFWLLTETEEEDLYNYLSIFSNCLSNFELSHESYMALLTETGKGNSELAGSSKIQRSS